MQSSETRPEAAQIHIRSIVGLLQSVPDSLRSFTVGIEGAEREYRISRELCNTLRAEGVPCLQHGNDMLFDRYDLLNMALRLDSGSPQRKLLRWWVRELESSDGAAVTYRMEYTARCPDNAHPSLCRYDLLGKQQRFVVEVASTPDTRTLGRILFRLPRSWPPYTQSLRCVIEEFSDVEFMQLPDPLRWDTDFIKAKRIGDCTGMAKLLVQAGTELGLRARFCYGRALTPPFSSAHYWAEFLIEGIWTPVDPLMVGALHRLGLSLARWDRFASIGGILARLSDRWEPLALHNDQVIPVRLPTYRVNISADS